VSYPRGLDDYSDEELLAELDRRAKARALGKCDYCLGRDSKRPCGQRARHKEATA
jgi:hypothetical protein